MTSSLRKEINRRFHLLTIAQKTPKGSLEWSAYKNQRNFCTKLLRSAELNYWNSKFTNSKSSKEFWKLVKSFQGNFKSAVIGPVKDSSGSLLTDNLSKANELNSYFTNVRSTLANTYGTQVRGLSSTISASCIYRISPSLASFVVNRDILSHCFKRHIQVGKASSPDNISAKELQLLDDVFLNSFLKITTKSFAECKFPNQWKTAQV